MGLKVVFFCGHKSRYGFSHLIPTLNKFNVKVVIVATDLRWDIFQKSLIGETYYEPRNKFDVFVFIKLLAKKILPEEFIKIFRKSYRNPHNIKKNIRRFLHFQGIELWEVFDVNDRDFVDRIKKLGADIFISAAYPQIFSKIILDIPRIGAINFHPSLLPKYRGAHPHYWQIVNGEKEGGLTAHFMTEKLDDGDIIAQLSFPIEDCTYSQMYDRIIKNTPHLIDEVKTFFENQAFQPRPQSAKDATYYRNEREIHNRIFWSIHTSQEIYDLIRTERAFCFFRGEKIILMSSYITKSNRNLTNDVRIENGAIIDVGQDSISVKTVDGCINVKELKRGQKIFSYFDWAKKENIFLGEKFD